MRSDLFMVWIVECEYCKTKVDVYSGDVDVFSEVEEDNEGNTFIDNYFYCPKCGVQNWY